VSLFKSIFGVAADIVTTALVPVEIAADVTRSVTRPMAELAVDAKDGIKAIANPDERA
jgi:hypothetical protein